MFWLTGTGDIKAIDGTKFSWKQNREAWYVEYSNYEISRKENHYAHNNFAFSHLFPFCVILLYHIHSLSWKVFISFKK